MDTPREIYHQVKNHLAVYQSLLRLKRSTLESPGERRVASEMEARFSILTCVYQRIFSEGHSRGTLAAKPYLEEICETFRLPPWELPLESSLSPVDGERLTAQAAVPLGLLITELLLNAVLHAFPEPSPEDRAELSFNRISDRWELIVEDNGRGIPGNDSSGDGMGFSLVEALAAQLGGESRREAGMGTRWLLAFPEDLLI